MPKLKVKKAPPFPFVLDAFEGVSIETKPMFGCLALYLDEKIVLILREKEDATDDNGVWIATTSEHHASLKKELPSMRSIGLFGPGQTGWQNLPAEDARFETDVERVIRLVLKRDPRVGKVPARKRKKNKTRSVKSKR